MSSRPETLPSTPASASPVAIKVAMRCAGLTKTVSAHTFRHAFAMLLLQRGSGIRTLEQ